MRFKRKLGFYEKYIKRLLDVVCSLLFIIVFCWLYAIIAVIVRIKMGSPVLFKQPRPGIIKNGKETIFDMYKFRSMPRRWTRRFGFLHCSNVQEK